MKQIALATTSALALLACSKTESKAPAAPLSPAPAAAPAAGTAAPAQVPALPEAPAEPAVIPARPTPAATPTPTPPATPPAPTTPTAPGELGKVLSGITDGPTATAAKQSLESILKQLQAAKQAAAGNPAVGDLGKLAGGLANKAGIDLAGLQKGSLTQLDALLKNESVKQAIGPTLEQLKALLQ